MEPTRLYLDTAKLGRMTAGARRAHDNFSRLAAEEGGSPFFDHFLRAGAAEWPATAVAQYPGLTDWQGVGGLKDRLRGLSGMTPDLPVLLAHRSAQLMTFAARVLFGVCRNVLVTDLGWPGWHAVLDEAAERAGRRVTVAAVRDGVLGGGWDENDMVLAIRDCYRRAGCDGAFLSGVSNLGVRLPVARITDALDAVQELRFVVVDGAQELNHVPTDLGGGHCDLYLAGCHKWLGAAHPLAVGLYGRRRSRGLIDARLVTLTAAGVVDDPLLRLTARLEAGRADPLSETVSLVTLFTAHGAAVDAQNRSAGKPTDPSVVAAVAADAGWTPLVPRPGLRTSILLLRSDHASVRSSPAARVRDHFGRQGVSLTAYDGGIVRLSLPPGGIGDEHLSLLSTSLKSAHAV